MESITLFKPKSVISHIISPISSTLKSISFAHYFYYSSIFLIAKTSFDVISKTHNQRTKTAQIKALHLQDAKRYSFEQMAPESYSVLYYLYIKTYHSVFKSDLIAFKAYRRKLLTNNRQYHYIKYCQLFHKQMKIYELEILSSIAECFNIKYEIVKTIFSKNNVNYKEINGKYYSELEGMDLPSDLDSKKMEEIIQSLHGQYMSYYGKMKVMNLNIKEEKLQLISEIYAFDTIYFEYGIEAEVIEKCLYQNNLDLVEY